MHGLVLKMFGTTQQESFCQSDILKAIGTKTSEKMLLRVPINQRGFELSRLLELWVWETTLILTACAWKCRFLRGDQYAIALALLDEGKVVLGVLACPNLPLTSIARRNPSISEDKAGCLFFAQVDAGTYIQSLDGSVPTKVSISLTLTLKYFLLMHKFPTLSGACQCYWKPWRSILLWIFWSCTFFTWLI